MYRLTKEGLEYLEHGLPETALAKFVKKPITIAQAKSKMGGSFNIALAWAKKNGWIRLDNGMVILVKEPGKVAEEDALEAVEQGKVPPEPILKVLLHRRLIIEEKDNAAKRAGKLIGKEVTSLTPDLIKTGLWSKVKFKPYNMSAKGTKIHIGKRQPYNQFIDMVRRKLISLGFQEMTGPNIEMEFWNFDALYQAQNHPSRDWTQTYSLKFPKEGKLPAERIVSQVKATHENGGKSGSVGWGYEWSREKAARLMPRAHDTAISPRYLSGHSGKIQIPGKYFSLVRCYRPDVIDATHGVEFNQLGGIVIDENLSFSDLLGLLKEFMIEIVGVEKVKFYPDYYPFVEPGVQISAKHPELGWVELAGAGIFREELTMPLGIEEPVIAWGFGIDRLAMFKLGISNIRELFSRNLSWLRNSKTIF